MLMTFGRWWIAGMLLCFAACSGPSSEDLAAATAQVASLERQLEMKDAEHTQYEQTIDRLKAEVAERLEAETVLTSQVEVLKLKEDPSGAVDALRARADACERQLVAAGDRAASLENQQRAAKTDQFVNKLLTKSPAQSRPRSTRTASNEPKDRYVLPREPYVTLNENGEAIIEGTIHNTNSSSIEGFLRIDLLVNGQSKRSETIPMTLGANSVESYSTRFHSLIVMAGTSVRATAEWDKER